jgi:hypothetical protein
MPNTQEYAIKNAEYDNEYAEYAMCHGKYISKYAGYD